MVTQNDYKSVTFTSANSGEGVSTIALALAQRNLLAGSATLLVDLNTFHPSLKTLIELDHEKHQTASLPAPSLVHCGDEEFSIIGVPAPVERAKVMELRKPGVLEKCIEKWHENFDIVIIDATPVNRVNSQNIPTERIAGACDACLLVVRTGTTLQTMVDQAISRLQQHKVNIVGCILNDMDNPPLLTELLRQCNKLAKRWPKLSRKLASWCTSKQLLYLDD